MYCFRYNSNKNYLHAEDICIRVVFYMSDLLYFLAGIISFTKIKIKLW